MTGNRKAVGYLLLVFLLGAALGAGGIYWATSAELVQAKKKEVQSEEPESPVDWLCRELDLSSEQREQLGRILDETQRKYEAISDRYRPEYEEARQAGRDQIRAILSEKQRAMFEELVQRIDEKERKMRAQKQKELEKEKENR